jgi:hypothetical protein
MKKTRGKKSRATVPLKYHLTSGETVPFSCDRGSAELSGKLYCTNSLNALVLQLVERNDKCAASSRPSQAVRRQTTTLPHFPPIMSSSISTPPSGFDHTEQIPAG